MLPRDLSIQPEHSLGIGGLGAGHSELDPVLDGNVLDLARSPDVTCLHCVLEDLVASVVSDADGALGLGSNFEGLVVASTILGLLSHQTHVGDLTKLTHLLGPGSS